MIIGNSWTTDFVWLIVGKKRMKAIVGTLIVGVSMFYLASYVSLIG